MKGSIMTWQMWAVLSAVFAALTAILAKVGIQNINSDFATFIRTIVVLLALGVILLPLVLIPTTLFGSVPAAGLPASLPGSGVGRSWWCRNSRWDSKEQGELAGLVLLCLFWCPACVAARVVGLAHRDFL